MTHNVFGGTLNLTQPTHLVRRVLKYLLHFSLSSVCWHLSLFKPTSFLAITGNGSIDSYFVHGQCGAWKFLYLVFRIELKWCSLQPDSFGMEAWKCHFTEVRYLLHTWVCWWLWPAKPTSFYRLEMDKYSVMMTDALNVVFTVAAATSASRRSLSSLSTCLNWCHI